MGYQFSPHAPKTSIGISALDEQQWPKLAEIREQNSLALNSSLKGCSSEKPLATGSGSLPLGTRCYSLEKR